MVSPYGFLLLSQCWAIYCVAPTIRRPLVVLLLPGSLPIRGSLQTGKPHIKMVNRRLVIRTFTGHTNTTFGALGKGETGRNIFRQRFPSLSHPSSSVPPFPQTPPSEFQPPPPNSNHDLPGNGRRAN
ncbi:hypothetical protein B0T18DRAFT_18394 [Schizothecium vesticola]|uniref:Secreted protein n=1 Tax=Schizothecium vesticola TaxID=314040 RepID=A0AA40KBX8_9PEZI|nr:hypothetical protein B0T18DRAFT_18394 [Schizothecium vesticola]